MEPLLSFAVRNKKCSCQLVLGATEKELKKAQLPPPQINRMPFKYARDSLKHCHTARFSSKYMKNVHNIPLHSKEARMGANEEEELGVKND